MHIWHEKMPESSLNILPLSQKMPFDYVGSPAKHIALIGLVLVALLLTLTTSALATGPNGEQCGPKNGGASCGLNTCCSSSGHCGTTSDYCGANCQPSFGSCTVPTAPKCDVNGGSATKGRRVGYWQVQQIHDRPCGAVLPADINTAGLTHLLLSFAHFDPTTFEVVPANNADVEFYNNFTSLQSHSLQTWIAIGGGEFSTAKWSAMAATSASRRAFVSSLKSFMEKHSFQGVDLDWEFPDPSGSDAQNFVALAKEIKETIHCGISAAIPSDWGSVQGFDINGLSNYLDFFNYMAYDIHGWAIDGSANPAKVTYPADIRDIEVQLMSLWANATRPGQLNLGIPYYGRGYTLADSKCTTEGCGATGPSGPGKCAPDPSGVMTLDDLATIIAQQSPTIVLDRDAMQKRATWGKDQWLGYDDVDTLALKRSWADAHCFGGLMAWTVDFHPHGL